MACSPLSAIIIFSLLKIELKKEHCILLNMLYYKSAPNSYESALLALMTLSAALMNFEIRQSIICYAGFLGRWDKRIVDQESDVPSIIFSYTFYRLRALKTLYFHLCNFIKKN